MVEYLNVIKDLGSNTHLECPRIQIHMMYFNHQCHIMSMLLFYHQLYNVIYEWSFKTLNMQKKKNKFKTSCGLQKLFTYVLHRARVNHKPCHIRYACVIWFIFSRSPTSTNQTRTMEQVCCISKSMISIGKNLIEQQSYLDSVTIINNACLLIPQMNTHVLPNVFSIEVWNSQLDLKTQINLFE